MYHLKPCCCNLRITAWNSAFDVIHPKGFVFDGEMHDFWEMVYVDSGHAIAATQDQIYHLSEGQILFHKPMEFHRIRSAISSSPHLLILSFAAEGCGLHPLERKCFSLNETEKMQYHEVFHLVTIACQLYQQNLMEPYADVSSKAASALEYLLHCLTQKAGTKNIPVSRDELSYNKIISVINEHCTENLSVPQIADLCCMSISNMKRLFRLYCDRGIAKYFQTIKIQKAIDLMKNNTDISKIAEMLNYSSVNYFHTAFRRETGMTPGQYRRTQIVSAKRDL